jgi:predicted DNA-binding ribbon-helix-helix protein
MKKKDESLSAAGTREVDAERAKARQFRAASREGMTTTTITLEKADYRAMRIAALDEGVAVAELFRGIVRDWLAGRAKAQEKKLHAKGAPR